MGGIKAGAVAHYNGGRFGKALEVRDVVGTVEKVVACEFTFEKCHELIKGHHTEIYLQNVDRLGRGRARCIKGRLYRVVLERGIRYLLPGIVPVGIPEQAIGNAVVGNQLAETGGLQDVTGHCIPRRCPRNRPLWKGSGP